MQEEAERALTEEFGPDFLAGREVQVLKGEYSMDHLDAWYRTLSGAISQVSGIVYADLDEGKNRIEIVMYPRRRGREEMEAAIATVDVPRVRSQLPTREPETPQKLEARSCHSG